MPRRIALFDPYMFDEMYGNHRYILGMMKYMDRSRYEPIFVSQVDSTCSSKLRAMGVETVTAPPPSRLQRFGGAIMRQGFFGKTRTSGAIAWYTRSLYRCFRRHRTELVQFNNLRGLLVGGPAARMARLPVVWYVKGHLENPTLDSFSFAFADRILFQSEANRDRKYPKLVQRYAHKIQIVRNGLDFEAVDVAIQACDHQALKNQLNIHLTEVHFVYLGLISPLKGIHILLDAAFEAKRRIPGLRLTIVGSAGVEEFTEYERTMKTRVERACADWIKFLGYRSDAMEILAHADVLVLPSLSEGSPRSIMEAMALGKPVISTRVGGVPDLVESGVRGVLVEPQDKESLIHAMIELASDQEKRKRFGRAAEEYVRRFHSMRHSVDALMSVYDSVLAKRDY